MQPSGPPPIDHLLGRLVQDLSHAGELRNELLWQLAAIALCLILAGWGGLVIERRRTAASRAAAEAAGTAAAAAGSDTDERPDRAVLGVVRALLALGLLVLARIVLLRFYHANVVTLVVTLVLALALVRMFSYALQRALPGNSLFTLFGRLLGGVIWVAVALHVTGVLPDIVRTLNSLALPVGEQTVSMWTVLRGVFWVFVAVLVSLWIGNAIDHRLMSARSLNSSLRVGLARLVRAVLIAVSYTHLTLPTNREV